MYACNHPRIDLPKWILWRLQMCSCMPYMHTRRQTNSHVCFNAYTLSQWKSYSLLLALPHYWSIRTYFQDVLHKMSFFFLKGSKKLNNTHISCPPMMSVNVYIIPNISFPREALNFTLTDTHGENCLSFLSFKSEKWHMSNHYPKTFNALKLAHG